MTAAKALSAESLYQRCDALGLAFKTTDELPDVTEVIGQARAVEALEFGFGIAAKGYNIFALGRDGIGKRTIVLQLLNARAAGQSVPPDWCYVNNFDAPQKPVLLRLPPGKGGILKKDMEAAVDTLRGLLPAVFDGEDYQLRRRAIEEQFKDQREKSLEQVQAAARERNITLIRTPNGFAFAPLRGEEVVGPEEYERLPETDRVKIERDIDFLRELLQGQIRRLPQLNRDLNERMRRLNHDVARDAVSHTMEGLRGRYAEYSDVLSYFTALERDVVEHFDEFLQKGAESEGITDITPFTRAAVGLRRYQVNVLVTRSDDAGAPIVHEDNPTYTNLVGRSEHVAQLGALLTDFTMIRAGALHRANGGYLILDARKVLLQPFAWEGLKRALQAREVRIESLGQAVSLVSTVSLEAQPMPLDVKVVLLGDPDIYDLLHENDPEFAEHFKVIADFSRDLARSRENDRLFARLIATTARREKLLPFDCDAVARVIEQGAREMEDAERVAMSMRLITDILLESNYWAVKAARRCVTRQDVQRALNMRIYRMDRIRERLHDETMRDTILIDTDGAVVGQVNALTVMELGGFEFGRPSRITARVWPGDGDVLDIEREVDLGGAIHSKGVLIMQGFLAQRYARERALSMAASLVFEQSYGEVDGDSASAAELFALISAIADVPIHQHFAVTGAVNQHGVIQAIGGVNEKIEGFFKLCAARGLTGKQGVLIPAANTKHLMLEQAVIDAVVSGQFHIYAIENVDQGIALLTGREMGELDRLGKYPLNSLNYLVSKRLEKFHEGSEEGGEGKKKKRRKEGPESPVPGITSE